MWKKPVSIISAESHHKTTCFPIRPCFFTGATKKNLHWTNGTPIESAWNYRRRVGRWRLKKRGWSGFSRGKIGFVANARASSHHALHFSLLFATNVRSRGQKGLIEFLLINCLRGATIIATHELSHYRNCRSN